MNTALRVLASTWLAGCATVVTSVRTERIEMGRRPFERRVPAGVHGGVQTRGAIAQIRVDQDASCQRGTLVSGEAIETTTRTVTNNGTLASVASIGGLGVLFGGLALIGGGGPFGSSPSGDLEIRVAGGATLGVGAVLTIPWLVSLGAGGESVSRTPFSAAEITERAACDTRPYAGRPVSLASADGTFHVERTLDSEGRTEIDLLFALPPQALRGVNRWQSVGFLVDGRVEGQVSLDEAVQTAADRDWEAAEGARDTDALARFRTEFPDDDRVDRAAQLLVEIREEHAARANDAQRRDRWLAAGNDLGRLQSVVDEQQRDAYAVAATCRLQRASAAVGSAADRRNRCRDALAALGAAARQRGAVAIDAGERDLRDLNEIVEREEAAVAQARARAEANATQARARAEAAAGRERALVAARARTAIATARRQIASCRTGNTGPVTARVAYLAIANAGPGADAGTIATLRQEIMRACQATARQSGVP